MREKFVKDKIIPGQLICCIKKPQYGEAGKRIDDTLIEPIKGKEIEIHPGNGIYVTDNGTKFFSKIYGEIFYEDNVIDVEPVLEISSPNQPIKFEGRVKIKGNISKIKLQAQSIEIDGNVDDCELLADGNIYIRGELKGSRSLVRTKRKVVVNLINGGSIEACYLLVYDGIFQANIKADIVVCEKKGEIINSKIDATSYIYAKKIGKPGKSSTLQAELTIKREDGKIQVKDKVYGKLQVKIGKLILIVKKELSKVEFLKEGNKIVPKKLQFIQIPKPQFKLFQEPGRNNLPISVLIKTTDEFLAKKEAEKLLSIKFENLSAYRVDEEYVRVHEANKIGPWNVEWKAEHGIAKDGSFHFENRADGLYLHVIHHQGKGKPVTLQDILSFAQRKGFENLNIERIKEILEKRIEDFHKVADRQVEKDAIKLEISENKMKAYAIVKPPKEGGLLVKMEDFYYMIQKANIKVPIKRENIIEALHKLDFDKKIEIAEGILPQSPTQEHDAKFIYKYELKEVIPGQLLAVKSPPSYPKAGCDVLGNLIPPQRGKDFLLKAGRNTYILEDRQRIYATSFGELRWREGSIIKNSQREKVLQPTVCMFERHQGNIEGRFEFSKSLQVYGDIKENAKVNLPNGDLEIEGNIEAAAEIIVNGDIEVKGQIEGKGKCKIKCINLKANFIKDVQIEAEGRILVEEGIERCVIKGYQVICKGKRGITDSKIDVKDLICAKIIGKENKQSRQEMKLLKDGQISFFVLYPKVLINIGGVTLIAKKPLKRTTLYVEGQRIVSKEYQETEGENYLKDMGENRLEYEVSVALRREEGARASELLGIDQKELTYTPFTEGFFLFHPKVEEGPWTEKFKERWHNLYGPKVDGEFKIENTKDGLFLHIRYPQRGGQEISLKEILKEIKDKGYQEVDMKEIEQMLKERRTNIKIGPVQFTKEFGGILDVKISDDKKSAFIKIIPPLDGEVLIDLPYVLRVLEKKGIKFGVDKERIAKALQNKEYNKDIEIALAKEPTQGEDGKIIYFLRD